VDAVIVSDPPFNIGYDYGEGCSDNMEEDDYWTWLESILIPPCCIIHYPEMLFKFAFQIGQFPDDCFAWIYHANTARQWRMAAWFGIMPDFGLVRQPYRNPNDKRIRQLVANGSKGSKSYNWLLCEQVKNISAVKTEHPCQMPLTVMERIVGVTPCETVIDPFMGSGTTGIACIRTGRRFIGIEVSPIYYELAKERIIRELEQQLLPLDGESCATKASYSETSLPLSDDSTDKEQQD
jgi:hypothetical protein